MLEIRNMIECIFFMVFMFVCVIVMTAVASPVTTAIDPIDIINQGNELVNAIATKSVGVGSVAGMLAYFLINIMKMKTDKDGNTLADKIIPKRYRPLVASIIGATAGILGTVLTGGTLPLAISVGITSGAIPTLIHELINTTVKDGKNK